MKKIDRLQQLRKQMIKKTGEQVRQRFENPEDHIIRAVNTLQDLDSMFNLMLEHIRTWYGLHFPELEKKVRNYDLYLDYVIDKGFREEFGDTEVKEIAEKSIGSKIDPADLERIQGLGKVAQDVKNQREALSNYVDEKMKKTLPNFTALAGSLLGAKLLSIAGSRKRLSEMPASTLQLLGAEKALFQHLKSGSKPPKHGLIFQHPLVQKMKRKQRGKLSRTIAAKLSIAAKEDFFGDRDISQELQKKIDARITELSK
jgi:nucleolar protein 56